MPFQIDWGETDGDSIDFGISTEDSGDIPVTDIADDTAGNDVDWGDGSDIEIEVIGDDTGVIVMETDQSNGGLVGWLQCCVQSQ